MRANAIEKQDPNPQTGDPGWKPTPDSPELKISLAKAMCRQYIMWPITDSLPCEDGVECDKRDQCTEMANGVLDYRDDLAILKKISTRG